VSWLGRLNRKLIRYRGPVYLGDNKALSLTEWGYKIIVDSRDITMAPHLLLDGVWEPHVSRAIWKRLKPGMRVLDIGSNFGYYALMAAARVGPSGFVHAFEPQPEVFEILAMNVRMNGHQAMIRCNNFALGDSQGDVELNVFTKYAGAGSLSEFSEAFQIELRERVRRIRVPIRVLDEMAELNDQRIDFIRMDVEGAEPLIVRGAKKIISRDRPLLVLEFSTLMLRGAGHSPEAFLREFQNWGYKIYEIRHMGYLSRVRDIERFCQVDLHVDLLMEPKS